MKQLKIVTGILLLSLIASCSSEPKTKTEHTKIVFSAEFATEAEKLACEEVGGTVQKAGMLGNEHCIQVYADAEAECTDSSQCLGRCTLRVEEVAIVGDKKVVGRCELNDSPFGCIQEVKKGTTQPAICID
ncbi:MAG: hypothetical protein Hens3KO_08070 [Henriciella sp.]